MARMILLVALAIFAGCGDDGNGCPDSVTQAASCSPEGLYCPATDSEGTCTCTSGRFRCNPFFTIHDLAVPDLAPPPDLSPSTD